MKPSSVVVATGEPVRLPLDSSHTICLCTEDTPKRKFRAENHLYMHDTRRCVIHANTDDGSTSNFLGALCCTKVSCCRGRAFAASPGSGHHTVCGYSVCIRATRLKMQGQDAAQALAVATTQFLDIQPTTVSKLTRPFLQGQRSDQRPWQWPPLKLWSCSPPQHQPAYSTTSFH